VPRSSLGWTAAVWLTVCAGLTAVVAYQLTTSFPLAPMVTAAPPGAPLLEAADPPDEPRSPSEDAVDEIAARPLFSSERRPYVAPPAPVEEAPVVVESSLPVELAGTFLTPNDRAALLLVAGRTPAWLRSGQTIEGWEIGSIEQDRVILLKGGQERELLLREDKAGPPQSAGVPRRGSRQKTPAERQESEAEPRQNASGVREVARGLDEDRPPFGLDDEDPPVDDEQN